MTEMGRVGMRMKDVMMKGAVMIFMRKRISTEVKYEVNRKK